MGLLDKVRASPILARVVPLVVLIALTALQGQFGEDSRYWVYLLKTIVTGWLLWSLRREISEMKLVISWEGIVAGVLVAGLWIFSNSLFPSKTTSPAWNPFAFYGTGALAWFYVVVRMVGSGLVVPFAEEIFFRSFLYRYLVKVDFLSVSFRTFHTVAFFVTAIIFAVEHQMSDWLGGILCAFIYQGLVLYKGRIGDAITAHAVTNLLLGGYVIYKGAWQFW